MSHKMWGDRYKQFAQLRTLLIYLMAHPGKKLLFMGGEWGQFLEWKFNEGLEWHDLADPMNYAMQQYTKKLNEVYRSETALWELEETPQASIEFIDADNHEQVVLSFIRKGKRKKDFLIFVFNFSAVEYPTFELPVPFAGTYEEILNTEMAEFGGTWTQIQENLQSQPVNNKKYQHAINLVVPALGAVILKPKTISLSTKR